MTFKYYASKFTSGRISSKAEEIPGPARELLYFKALIDYGDGKEFITTVSAFSREEAERQLWVKKILA
jgi:hypothetical protein